MDRSKTKSGVQAIKAVSGNLCTNAGALPGSVAQRSHDRSSGTVAAEGIIGAVLRSRPAAEKTAKGWERVGKNKAGILTFLGSGGRERPSESIGLIYRPQILSLLRPTIPPLPPTLIGY